MAATDVVGEAHRAHAEHGEHDQHGQHDASLGMSGMVLGITVTPRTDAPAPANVDPVPSTSPPVTLRRLTMDIHHGSEDGRAPAGISVTEADGPEPTDGREVADGPQPVVLRRGEPVEITLVNHLDRADVDALARPRAGQRTTTASTAGAASAPSARR